MEPTVQTLDIRDLLWRLHRYKWILALPPIAALCVASVYYKTSPVIYESHVVVSLGDQASVGPALQPMVSADRDRGTSGERMVLVDSKLRSRGFLNAVVGRLGLLDDPGVQAEALAASQRHPEMPRAEFAGRIAAARVEKQMRVSPIEGNYVRVTTTSGTAEGAQRLAATITDLLIEESRRTSLERVQARGEFSQDQVLVYQERLRESENALQAYQETVLRRALTSTPISDGNVNEARGILRATDQEIEQTRDRIEVAREQWSLHVPGEAPPSLTGRSAEELERRLSSAEIDLAVASLGGERTELEMPGLQGTVASIRQSLLLVYENLAASLPGNVPDGARASVAGMATDRAILRSLRAKRDRVAGFISQFARGVENSPREQMELARLRSAVESNRELLNSLQREAQSTRISEALASSAIGPRLTVIDPPQLPLRPSAPDPIRIFGAALLLGPLLSVGIVFASEKFTLVIRTVEQAEQEMGSRVLGTVPRIDGWTRREGYFARHWVVLSILLVLVLTGIFHSLNATILGERPARTGSAPPTR